MGLDLKQEIARITPELVALRRDFHQHPELAFHETRTAQVIAERLRSLGLEVQTGVGKTGVVGLLHGRSGSRTIGIRADIDALPITETVALPYRSQNQGIMHACGHDGHAAAALSVARILAEHRDEVPGTIKFLFQPAEESANGAEEMIKDGAFRNPTVDAILSLHLWNYLPVGTVGFRAGAIFASADEVHIVIQGKGGHGGLPHQTIDPIPVAAQIILALQLLVSRNISPFDPAVLTIGMVQAGSAFNVIPEQVTMKGTIRAYDMKVRDYLVERAEETVRGICLGAGATYEFNSRFCCPPVVNDEGVTAVARRAAQRVLGEGKVVTAAQATTGDDVAYFNQQAPGCYFLVGSGNAQKGYTRPHHHQEFDFDEDALPVAVAVLAQGALDLLEQK